MRVVLLEEDSVRQSLLEQALRGRGHEVVSTPDPASAWAALRAEAQPFLVLARSAPGERIDLCRRARALPQNEQGVILVVCPENDPAHLQELIEAGADDWLPEPIDPELLDLRLHVAERRLRHLAPRPLPAGPPLDGAETFRTLVETMSVGVGVRDRDGIITYANAKLCEMLGYEREELVGRPVTDLVPPEDREVYAREVVRRRAGEAEPYELEMIARDGSRITTTQAPRALLDGEGRFLGSFSLITDITEQKEAEAALRVNQFLLDRAPEAAGWADEQGRMLYMNQAACSSLEYSLDELLRMRVQDVLPEEFALKFEGFTQTLRDHGMVTFESAHITKSGRRFPVEVALNCLEFNGREYFCAFIRDITSHKQSEQALRESEERYRSLFDGVPVGLYRTTPAGLMLDANESLVRILGYPDRETLLQANVGDIYYDREDRLRWQRTLQAETGSRVQTFEARVRRHDGPIIWVRFSLTASRDEDGQILRYEGALEDVTDRKRAEEALRASEERFRALVQNASDMITILEPEGTVRYGSPSHFRLLGHQPEDLLGRSLLDLVHPEDRPLVANALQCLVDLPDENLGMEFRCQHRNGTWRMIESTASNLLDHPAVKGIILNSHDITDRKRAEERLLHDALHDELTGLPNRALFMDRLWQAMERSRREPQRLTAVLFLDVDQFKIVNDSLGHLIGDELLIHIASSLSSVLRPMDTIARIGGDEFAILVEGGHGVEDAVCIADRVHERLATPVHLRDQELYITASIGIAVCTPEYERPEDLLRDADTAMYRAKSSGRACHVVFNRGMHHFVMARLQTETDLRRAVDRGQLRVHYQPFVDLRDGTVMGFEALVRWLHPERGLILPDEFLGVAEETGLILPIGRHVLLESCRRIREIQLHHPEHRRLRLSVNLSNRQFFQTDLCELITEALETSGLPPECLGLEITEGVIIRHVESAIGRFGRLKSLGVQLYLDDFGKGHSSFDYLHRFPMDILKIDRSFVARIEENPSDVSIVSAIVTMAHQLGMEVVAEGIQTPEQVSKVRGLDCEYGQGFFFSRPIDGDEAERLVLRTMDDWPSVVAPDSADAAERSAAN
jgi:diguanylate cyclase (GGDEF)-like protein/PAS domain S-box-containing protein